MLGKVFEAIRSVAKHMQPDVGMQNKRGISQVTTILMLKKKSAELVWELVSNMRHVLVFY